jgi:hypothetical protein
MLKDISTNVKIVLTSRSSSVEILNRVANFKGG